METIAADNKCKSESIICENIKNSGEMADFIIGEVVSPKEQKRWTGIQTPVGGINIEWKSPAIHPQTRLVNALSNEWKSMEKKTQLFILFLDDLQNLTPSEDVLLTLRNTFIKLLQQGARYMLIVTGTDDIFAKFSESPITEPLTRFFEPMKLTRLTEKETREAITKPLQDTGVEFEDNIVNKIIEISEGHPYYIQLLCEKIYDKTISEAVYVADVKIYECAFGSALNSIAEQRFNNLYNKASESEKPILDIIANSDVSLSHSNVAEMAINKNINKKSVAKLISRLKDKELVKKTESGKYKIFDKFFEEYVRLR